MHTLRDDDFRGIVLVKRGIAFPLACLLILPFLFSCLACMFISFENLMQ